MSQPVEALLLAVALALVSLRLFLRLVLQRTRLTLSDWLLIASGIDGIALFATDAAAYRLGGMDDYDPDAPPAPEAEQIRLMKITFAGNYLYDTGIYFPKLALLAFYYRLIPPTMPLLRKVLYVATVLTVVFAITTCFVDTFWCGSNVPVNWDPEGSCSSFESMEIVQIDWALNITSDVLSMPFHSQFKEVSTSSHECSIFHTVSHAARAAGETKIHGRPDCHILSRSYYCWRQCRQVCYHPGDPCVDQCLYVLSCSVFRQKLILINGRCLVHGRNGRCYSRGLSTSFEVPNPPGRPQFIVPQQKHNELQFECVQEPCLREESHKIGFRPGLRHIYKNWCRGRRHWQRGGIAKHAAGGHLQVGPG